MRQTIVTTYEPKPIPLRSADWQATTKNYDEGSPIGFGSTEQEAIDDLLCKIEGEEDA